MKPTDVLTLILYSSLSILHLSASPVDEVLDRYFHSPQEVQIDTLAGGHSNTSLRLTVDGKSSVLRIKAESSAQSDLQREIYAMREAAKLGIAPQILYHTPDCKAILMDYVEGGVATLDQIKKPENCRKIAASFRKVHATAKNPYFEEDSNESALNAYNEICHFPGFKERLDEALALMWSYSEALSAFDAPKVNLHGELNSRNIFLTEERAIFIDWECTCWEDPFSDLCYFAMRAAFDEAEERALLEYYLERPPTQGELERYALVKRYNYAQLSIWFHYFCLKFNKERRIMRESSPMKSWSQYMRLFSDKPDDESELAQFYYDLAVWSLELAKG